MTTTYTLDLASSLTQVLSDGTTTYLYGNMRIAQQDSTSTEYFLPDALGSVRQLVDETGTVTLVQSFQPYGETLTHVSDGGASAYGFTGAWTDSSGLVHLRARYYAPPMARFLTRDPWHGDPLKPMSYNSWLYVYSNPINLTDPSGMIPCHLLPPEDQAACQAGGGGTSGASTTPQPTLPSLGPPYCTPVVVYMGLACIPIPCPLPEVGSGGGTPGDTPTDDNPLSDLYGVKFVNVKGVWSDANIQVALQSIAAIGAKFAAIPGIGGAPWEAFRKIYGITTGDEMLMQWNTQCYHCRAEKLLPKCVDKEGNPVFSAAHDVLNKKGKPTGEIVDCQAYGAYTYSSRQIAFAEFFGKYHVAHELGHAFDNRVGSRGRNALPDYLYNNRVGFLQGIGIVQNSAPTPSEGFADMFTGWVYDGWDLNKVEGVQRQDFMNKGIGGPPGFVGMDQLARCAAYGTCPTIP